MSDELDLRSITELVGAMCDDPRRYEQESVLGAVVHLATYDLDYYGYILVQTWDFLEAQFGDTEAQWEYSLWFQSSNPVKIADFPLGEKDDTPFVQSAQAVLEHMRYISDYTHEHHEFPEIE